MLLYIGPCFDIVPVQNFSYKHKIFIYVDSLPESNYYPLYSTKDLLIGQITNSLKRENALESFSIIGNVAYILTTGGNRIIYFMNTSDVLMENNTILNEYLKQVDTLYISGYSPKITTELPNLKNIISTNICIEDIGEYLDLDQYKITIIKNYDHLIDFDDSSDVKYFIECDSCGEDMAINLFEDYN